MNAAEAEQLDKYFEGSLTGAERSALQDRMKTDAFFKKEAESHLDFLHSLKSYSDRKILKQDLESIHNEMNER